MWCDFAFGWIRLQLLIGRSNAHSPRHTPHLCTSNLYCPLRSWANHILPILCALIQLLLHYCIRGSFWLTFLSLPISKVSWSFQFNDHKIRSTVIWLFFPLATVSWPGREGDEGYVWKCILQWHIVCSLCTVCTFSVCIEYQNDLSHCQNVQFATV